MKLCKIIPIVICFFASIVNALNISYYHFKALENFDYNELLLSATFPTHDFFTVPVNPKEKTRFVIYTSNTSYSIDGNLKASDVKQLKFPSEKYILFEPDESGRTCVDMRIDNDKGNYYLKVVYTWDLSVQDIPSQQYTGDSIKPEPVVFSGMRLLRKNADYTVSYENNVGVGTATIVIDLTEEAEQDCGGFGKEFRKTFEIVKSTISYELNGGELENITSGAYVPGNELPKPTREKYDFGGWFMDEELFYGPITKISDNFVGQTKLYAKWKIANENLCVVSFLDVDGSTIRKDSLICGESVVPPTLPSGSVPASNGYVLNGYVFYGCISHGSGSSNNCFNGWDKKIPESITENMEIKAVGTTSISLNEGNPIVYVNSADTTLGKAGVKQCIFNSNTCNLVNSGRNGDSLKATPNEHWRFSMWSTGGTDTSMVIKSESENTEIAAFFEPDYGSINIHLKNKEPYSLLAESILDSIKIDEYVKGVSSRLTPIFGKSDYIEFDGWATSENCLDNFGTLACGDPYEETSGDFGDDVDLYGYWNRTKYGSYLFHIKDNYLEVLSAEENLEEGEGKFDILAAPEEVNVNYVVYNGYPKDSYATIVLPFDFELDEDKSSVDNKWAKFYKFTEIVNDDGVWKIVMDRVGKVEGEKLEAGVPYVVINKSENSKIKFEKNDGQIKVNKLEAKSHGKDQWNFVAASEFKEWGANDLNQGVAYYGFARCGVNEQCADEVKNGAFVKVGAGASITPLHAYLTRTRNPMGAPSPLKRPVASLNEVPEFVELNLVEVDGETTVIGKLNTRTGKIQVDRWYDMKGRALNGRPTAKGNYFHNNKLETIR